MPIDTTVLKQGLEYPRQRDTLIKVIEFLKKNKGKAFNRDEICSIAGLKYTRVAQLLRPININKTDIKFKRFGSSLYYWYEDNEEK